MILAAGEGAHLQTAEKVSHAKSINGEIFIEIGVEDIENNPMQPRLQVSDEELSDLARSIKLHGLIQPIAVISKGEGKYILKAGQRRWLAHKKLGLEKIKAIVQEETIIPQRDSDRALFEIAVLENTQRDNLVPLELALALKNALDRKLYKNLDELSMALSKSKSYISKVLKVLSLQNEIIEDLGKNKSTNDIESLYEMQKITDPVEQVRVYFDFIAKKIDRKALREMNKKPVTKEEETPYRFEKKASKIKLEFDVAKFSQNEVDALNNELEEVLKKYLR